MKAMLDIMNAFDEEVIPVVGKLGINVEVQDILKNN
jgi:hypothetical protein